MSEIAAGDKLATMLWARVSPSGLRALEHGRGTLLASACVCLAAWGFSSTAWAGAQTDDASPPAGLGPSPRYEDLRHAAVAHVGQIRQGRIRVDRFEVELTDGQLYMAPAVGGRVPAVVFVGDGVLRGYPPDAVEHHQLKKLSDEHAVEESFDRLVLWSVGNITDQLRTLATPTDSGEDGDTDGANTLLEGRRKSRLEQQLSNPDSRLLTDLLMRDSGTLDPDSTYVLVDLDTDDHGWLTVEVEPNDPEEVWLYRYDRRGVTDTWMHFQQLTDYPSPQAATALDGFSVDPHSLSASVDDDDISGAMLGLATRPHRPDHGRRLRLSVPRAEVDLALDESGTTLGTAALLFEPLEPTRGLRLRISSTLEVTDVRWRPDDGSGADTPLLARPDPADASQRPDRPTRLIGEQLHFVQERHGRRLDDDRFEPWVTVTLPRTAQTGERFILELAYEGELIERHRQTLDFVLNDTLYWRPQHPDGAYSLLDLTFRMPERYRVASGGTLVDERLDGDTRLMRWTTAAPVRSMSFHYGEFDVSEVRRDGLPTVSVYANEKHLGFSPGVREKTLDDLLGAIEFYGEYFGPYPYDSLLVTETQTQYGQAFPGLVLLSYQAFGELHTGEAELFRAHEVAHQWWGAGIDWAGYRDQWMTEGFAQYAAALFTRDGLNDPDQFEAMINAWRLDVLGEGHVGQGHGVHYGFRPDALQRSDAHESGPLVVGFRLNTADTPFDYRVIAYEKGAYILHMLRSMLLNPDTGDDSRFRALMRGYATAHVGGVMSTPSFEMAVSEAFDEPMDWFFDQWVYGVEVPTYRPDLEVVPLIDSPMAFVLRGHIRQEDVSDGFKMPVPIRITFDDHPPITRSVWVDAEEVQVEFPLPERPTRVEFNAEHGVLAKVR
ncbi:MAG: M1 family aminopeptidase [Acidobacteria bacterium]|nr:M1 family aminopeptidase [Acidobacteriota bacterium]